MKKTIFAGFVLATLMLTILTFAISPVLASPRTRVYIDPTDYLFDTDTATDCTRFNVTIKCENVVDMVTWQVKIFFDPTIINVTRWYEPTWDPNYVFAGKITLPTPDPVKVKYTQITPTNASAMVGSAIFPRPGPGGGFFGNGTLCIIEFHIEKLPGKGEELSCDLVIDPQDTFWIEAAEPGVKIFFDEYTNARVDLVHLWITSFIIVKPLPQGHDVAVIGVKARPTAVLQGEPVYINVTVENQGDFAETFDVAVYADRMGGGHVPIETRTVHLDIGESKLLEFVWDTTGVPYGSYWITAEAILPGDEDPADNIGRAWVGGICRPPNPDVDLFALIAPIISAIVAVVALGIIGLGFFKLLISERPPLLWRSSKRSVDHRK